MKNLMEYKGYLGSVEYSEEDDCLFGKVQGIRGLLSYEGQTIQELKQDFHEAVDEHLEYCRIKGVEPEKSFKGGFNVRIPEELHRAAFIYVQDHETNMNSVVIEALKEKLDRETNNLNKPIKRADIIDFNERRLLELFHAALREKEFKEKEEKVKKKEKV